MKRLLFLDKQSNEIENLLQGKKHTIIRATNIKKYPFRMLEKGYKVYFMNNDNKDIIYASATIEKADYYHLSDPVERTLLVDSLKDKLLLRKEKLDYVLKRKYISVFTLKDIKSEYATLDRSQYGKVDDWMIIKELD